MKRAGLAFFVLGLATGVYACGWALDGYTGGSSPSSGDSGSNDSSTLAEGSANDGGDTAPDGSSTETGRSLVLQPLVTDGPTDFDLSALGGIDWAQWSLQGTVRCKGCERRFGDLTANLGIQGYNDDFRRFLWSNGAPVDAGQTRSGEYVGDIGAKFTLTFLAKAEPVLVRLWMDSYYSGGRFQAVFQDDPNAGTAPSTNIPSLAGRNLYEVGIVVSANPPATVEMTLIQTSNATTGAGAGNLALIAGAAALANP